ncbi:hypothetical protein Tco_0328899 [Tanacetum coccineum]
MFSLAKEYLTNHLYFITLEVTFLYAFLVLKNDNDFSADLDRNLLRLASFPFSLCTSFKHFGDGRLRTASTLSGHTFNPSAFTLYPRNVPFLIPKLYPPDVDGTAWILLTHGLPMIPLYGDGDLTTMKFIYAEVECSSSPIFTSNDIFPSGHIISPLTLTNSVAAGTIGRNLLKQCSYRISKEEPPSTYMRWTKCPPSQLQ